jgi:hypothetical protein
MLSLTYDKVLQVDIGGDPEFGLFGTVPLGIPDSKLEAEISTSSSTARQNWTKFQ